MRRAIERQGAEDLVEMLECRRIHGMEAANNGSEEGEDRSPR